MKTKVKVLKVVIKGKIGFFKHGYCAGDEGIVENPLLAKDYQDPENARDLNFDLRELKLPNDNRHNSGALPVESAELVELEVETTYVQTASFGGRETN